ncbi:MAG TPA: hypothetical protein ENK23_08560, partial [Sorangium sp.]|nr:hypothetical protein [Sorangium sp.]
MSRSRSAVCAPAPPRALFAAAAMLLLGSAWSSVAAAQQPVRIGVATALDRYEASPYGDELMALPQAHVWSAFRPAFGLLFNGSYRPLVLLRSGAVAAEIVQYQLMLHAQASVELDERLKLDVNVPVTLAQAGEPLASTYLGVDSGAAFNDIRLGARIELLKQQGYWPS